MNHIIKCTNCGANYIAGQAGNCPYCVVIACNKNIAELVTENSIMREALERIAYMDDEVFSKGLYCSKIAKDALDTVEG